MKIFFHKIAAYTVVVFISAQPISIDVLAAEKESTKDIAFRDDDKSTPISTRKSLAESSPQICQNTQDAFQNAHKVVCESENTGTVAAFSLPTYLAKKAADFLAWVNTDIEADLH